MVKAKPLKEIIGLGNGEFGLSLQSPPEDDPSKDASFRIAASHPDARGSVKVAIGYNGRAFYIDTSYFDADGRKIGAGQRALYLDAGRLSATRGRR